MLFALLLGRIGLSQSVATSASDCFDNNTALVLRNRENGTCIFQFKYLGACNPGHTHFQAWSYEIPTSPGYYRLRKNDLPPADQNLEAGIDGSVTMGHGFNESKSTMQWSFSPSTTLGYVVLINKGTGKALSYSRTEKMFFPINPPIYMPFLIQELPDGSPTQDWEVFPQSGGSCMAANQPPVLENKASNPTRANDVRCYDIPELYKVMVCVSASSLAIWCLDQRLGSTMLGRYLSTCLPWPWLKLTRIMTDDNGNVGWILLTISPEIISPTCKYFSRWIDRSHPVTALTFSSVAKTSASEVLKYQRHNLPTMYASLFLACFGYFRLVTTAVLGASPPQVVDCFDNQTTTVLVKNRGTQKCLYNFQNANSLCGWGNGFFNSWITESQSSPGYYRVFNRDSFPPRDINMVATSDTLIQNSYPYLLSFYNDDGAMHWRLSPTGTQGDYFFINKKYGGAMTAVADPANDTLLLQPFDGSPLQQWEIYPQAQDESCFPGTNQPPDLQQTAKDPRLAVDVSCDDAADAKICKYYF